MTLVAEQLVILFAILVLGVALGRISIRGVSLGSAGVLFAALFFGHLGLQVSRELMEFGLVFFVYAVGLQAGPRFFRTFKKSGTRFLALGLLTVSVGAITALFLSWLLEIPRSFTAGLFCGALTNTPALAAAIDALQHSGEGLLLNDLSVGYGLAYPFGLLGVIILMKFLPRLLHHQLSTEAQRWMEEMRSEQEPLKAVQFRITNPNCEGKTLSELGSSQLTQANFCRIRRDNQVFPALPDFALHLGDVLQVVGTEQDLELMRLLLGKETQDAMDLNQNILSLDLDVTEDNLGNKTLCELQVMERFGVVITRLRREGIEIAPSGQTRLEIGDHLRVVGEKQSVEDFAKIVATNTERLEETSMLPFLVGLLLGVGLGSIPLGLLPGMPIKLGAAGGAFIVSLLLGHFGRIGRYKMHVPPAAKNFTRELGLMVFLAGVGTLAGARFFEIVAERGLTFLFVGALITLSASIVLLIVCEKMLRLNLLETMGIFAGSMTNLPSISAITDDVGSELLLLAYASTYPIALISKIVLAQLIAQGFFY